MREKIRIIIPAYNEEKSITKVIEEIPAGQFDEIIVVDNGSDDKTAVRAQKMGATVLFEPARGYGNACLKAISYINDTCDTETEIIVFMDADHSDYPEEIKKVIQPILSGQADFVIGSRFTGERQKGSMTLSQILGNWLSVKLLYIFYGAHFTDLGPFRAIKWQSLKLLDMKDKNYGWTVEMQLKALRKGLKYTEVPVRYRKRIGKSKVSGTVKGTLMAGQKIIWTIFKYI